MRHPLKYPNSQTVKLSSSTFIILKNFSNCKTFLFFNLFPSPIYCEGSKTKLGQKFFTEFGQTRRPVKITWTSKRADVTKLVIPFVNNGAVVSPRYLHN